VKGLRLVLLTAQPATKAPNLGATTLVLERILY